MTVTYFMSWLICRNFVQRKKEVKPKKLKHIDFTAIIEKSEDGWYVGQLEELPEVISQGKTIEELKNNLQDALELIISHQRETTLSLYQGRKFIRRKLSFAWWNERSFSNTLHRITVRSSGKEPITLSSLIQ